MTEAEWMACTDPRPMLEFLQGKASERKLRLFAVACWRRVWLLIGDERARIAVEVAERYADDLATDAEREAARRACARTLVFWQDKPVQCWRPMQMDRPRIAQRVFIDCIAAKWETASFARVGAIVVDGAGQMAACPPGQDYDPVKWQVESQEQCKLLRDIFGNPFRPVTLDPAVLAWNDSTVVRLAQAAYDERQMPEGLFDNSRLAVLADALEEAGCQDLDILSHCRSGGEDIRGCWVIDLLLGKS
jgi:hypothetical protein